MVKAVKDQLWSLSEGSEDQGSFLEVGNRFRWLR
jgi:hypothetical protein